MGQGEHLMNFKNEEIGKTKQLEIGMNVLTQICIFLRIFIFPTVIPSRDTTYFYDLSVIAEK